MKKSILYSFLLLIASCSTPPKKWSSERLSRYEESIRCELTNKYSVAQRRQMSPFNEAKKVVAIAFKNHSRNSSSIEIPDTIQVPNSENGYIIGVKRAYKSNCEGYDIVRTWAVPILNGTLMTKYCASEMVELNQTQIDTLSNILLNYRLNKKSYYSWQSCCYIPRNALLFLG